MENFSLTDLAWIVGSVSLFAVACVVMPPLLKYAPRFFVSLFHRYLWVDWDGFMSRLADRTDSRDLGTSSEADSADSRNVVPPHWNQVEPENDSESEAERESIYLRQLTRTEFILMLAIQKKDDGSYLHSANEIKEYVKGRSADVGEIISSVRGKKETPAPSRSIRKNTKGEWEPAR